MSKKAYRYFGGALDAQQKWLNRMAQRGWRLSEAGKFQYTFEPCPPSKYQYRVEFIGQKSRAGGAEYRAFLEEMGYRAFFKNANLHFSIGKVRYRPWAEKGGRVATRATTLDRELLIVEKENDGKPFELHTTFADRAEYYAALRNPWLCLCLVFGALGAVNRSWLFALISGLSLLPTLLYQAKRMQALRAGKLREE